MRFFLLACDYDGTLAREGRVGPAEERALERLRASGRKLILVTGRLLEDLLGAFPRADLFDRIVAENGAVLYAPESREVRVLAKPPPEEFVRALAARIGAPPATGRVLTATGRPHERDVLEAIRDAGLELHVIFNKGAVMVLPAGVTKATGLAAALEEMDVSPHNTVGVGDAENDHAFLDLCECAVAVRDALPAVRARADWVTAGGAGAGVVELVERILATDLRDLDPVLARHAVSLGEREGGGEVRIPPYGSRILLAGPSGSGKSSLARAILEQLVARAYQVCLVDPEGDYADFEEAPALGEAGHAPSLEEAARLLARPGQSLALNLLAVPLEDRPAFFASLLGVLRPLRVRAARPHWLVLDEAHHVLP
ncbi:MAG TPA: HAD-IIB family hydrolase, partial [Planctomycetota bacterium]|nr:HAD-IIB family hydrolase [Planctomycetota bacterium]